VDGVWLRHTSPKWPPLTGHDSGGRWGPPGSFPVLYLGRPRASAIVEAYRHLVDGIEGMRPDLVQRRQLVACDVACTQIVDLRDQRTTEAVGLEPADLASPVGRYGPYQAVGSVAHQLGFHGVLAPSATGLGETLALFERHLPASELPTLHGAPEAWEALPPDPGILRLVEND